MIRIDLRMHSEFSTTVMATVREDDPKMRVTVEGEFTPREVEAVSDLLYAAKILHEDLNESKE